MPEEEHDPLFDEPIDHAQTTNLFEHAEKNPPLTKIVRESDNK